MKTKTVKKQTKPARHRAIKRPAGEAGGMDLLKVAGKVRVPAIPDQDREAGPTAALLEKTVPPGRQEDEEKTLHFVFGDGTEPKEKLVIKVVHVNDKGERIEPTEEEKRLDRRIEGKDEN